MSPTNLHLQHLTQLSEVFFRTSASPSGTIEAEVHLAAGEALCQAMSLALPLSPSQARSLSAPASSSSPTSAEAVLPVRLRGFGPHPQQDFRTSKEGLNQGQSAPQQSSPVGTQSGQQAANPWPDPHDAP